ncbi:hypothetical protein LPJ53_004305 [Coemansia erecta]|uniref:Cation efflux protein transmembrane domain-containing protein n=1 Tax=Coemansia erecta TaxID=147472 RepID=A0A9W7XY30_9FUNG|nr:hypothetical protein LPJ53_004305 [Coemansia erecta]
MARAHKSSASKRAKRAAKGKSTSVKRTSPASSSSQESLQRHRNEGSSQVALPPPLPLPPSPTQQLTKSVPSQPESSNSIPNYGAVATTSSRAGPSSGPSVSPQQIQREPSCNRCERINSHAYSDSSTHSLSSSITKAEAILVPKFIAAQVDDGELRSISQLQGPKVAAFYEAQNELIADLLGVNQQHTDDVLEIQSEQLRFKQRQVDYAVRVSVVVNVLVVLAQLYAAISSKSLALFATMSEAMMDLLSSIILLLASVAARRSDRFSLYPTGRFKLETIGVIVFAVLMGTFSVALLVESVIALISAEGAPNQLTIYDAICVMLALIAKVFLYMYCYTLREYHAAHVLMTDHRNDVVVNAFGLAMAIIGKHLMPWMDPLGSLIIALIILRSWVEEAWDQIKLIIGIRADPRLLQVLTYTAITHDSRIEKVDRVVAYHSGAKLFVEVDIVMPPSTPLVTLHDVAESLQEKYERMPGVGRCHVHVDYEVTHRSEHQNALA